MIWGHLLLRHDLSQLDWYILLLRPAHTYPLSCNVPQIHLATWHISENHAERTPQAFLWESSIRTNSSQENISANLMNLPLIMILMLIYMPVLIYRNQIWHGWILPSSYAWDVANIPPLVTCHLNNLQWNLGSMTHFAITLHNHTIGAAVIPRFVTCLSRGKTLNILSPCHAAGNFTRQLLRILTLSWPSGNQ